MVGRHGGGMLGRVLVGVSIYLDRGCSIDTNDDLDAGLKSEYKGTRCLLRVDYLWRLPSRQITGKVDSSDRDREH